MNLKTLRKFVAAIDQNHCVRERVNVRAFQAQYSLLLRATDLSTGTVFQLNLRENT